MGKAMLSYSGSQYATFCKAVKQNGFPQDTRQGMSSELIMESFSVKPYDYIPAAESRRFNLGFGFVEAVSLLTGLDNIELFTRHIKSYGQFSTDGLRLDNSYGSRASDSIAKCLEILGSSDTEDARYAVTTINNSSTDLWSKSKHVPCTLSIQFLSRRGQLHQMVNMRSNDVFKGCAYDVFSFGLLHVIMAQNLGLRVGRYVTTAGSLHCYEYDYNTVDSMTNDSPLLLDFSHEFDIADTVLLGQCLLSEDFSTLPNSWMKDIALASFARWQPELMLQVGEKNLPVLRKAQRFTNVTK